LQYPTTDGAIIDYSPFIESVHKAGALAIVAADILALTLLRPPGEMGADVAIGSTQRFGVPLGCGGPHAAYFATRDAYKRHMAGRLVGEDVMVTSITTDSRTTAPGALPRVANAPGALSRTTTVTPPAASTAAEAPVKAEPEASEPVVVASVPMPRPAPQPKQGEAPASRPTTIAGLIGNLFGGTKAVAAPSTPVPEKEQVAVRSASTDLAAKPKPAMPAQTASIAARVTPVAPAPKSREAAPISVAESVRTPAPKTPTQQTANAEPPRAAQQSEIRTAYSTPPASNNGMLAGAQPVVPVGSFGSFR
jgi:hypothetical protein